MNHGIAYRLEFIGACQGELHFRQIILVILGYNRPGMHLGPNTVAFAWEHLENNILNRLFHGIINGLNLNVD
jgi:hypothetical protein